MAWGKVESGGTTGRSHLRYQRFYCEEDLTVKVALRALLSSISSSISLWERAGARETILLPTTNILRGGVDT